MRDPHSAYAPPSAALAEPDAPPEPFLRWGLIARYTLLLALSTFGFAGGLTTAAMLAGGWESTLSSIALASYLLVVIAVCFALAWRHPGGAWRNAAAAVTCLWLIEQVLMRVVLRLSGIEDSPISLGLVRNLGLDLLRQLGVMALGVAAALQLRGLRAERDAA